MKNIATIREVCPNVTIFANITISSLNILRLPEILTSFWAENVVYPKPNFICHNIVYDPEPLSFTVLPLKIRAKELIRLRNFRLDSEKNFGVKLPELEYVENLLSLQEESQQNIIGFLNERDAILGGSHATSLPNFSENFKS